MMDWWGVVCNALWIGGLAVGLAALSMADYQAQREKVRLWRKLDEPGLQLALDVGMMAFCLGLAFGSGVWWEWVIWGLLALLFAGRAAWVGVRLFGG